MLSELGLLCGRGLGRLGLLYGGGLSWLSLLCDGGLSTLGVLYCEVLCGLDGLCDGGLGWLVLMGGRLSGLCGDMLWRRGGGNTLSVTQ